MDRIFYKSELIDAYSGHPIYIFDTSYLPPPEDVDYNLFIPTLMQWLPKKPYVVILFSCGLNKINWVWGISFLKAFFSQDSAGVSNVENIHKLIAVHESWFVKSVSQIFTNFLVSKKTFANFNSLLSSLKPSNNLLISCDTLSDLSNYVDITSLKISLNVYRHDFQTTLTPDIALHCPFKPAISASTRFSHKTDPIFYHHFYQIFNIVDAYADQVELLFFKPGRKVNTEILFHCLMRNQVIWINDWDLNCVASCFKKILTEVSIPLIDSKKITLPMRDDLQYTSQIFDSMMQEEDRNIVLYQVISLCRRIVDKNLVTKHTNISILKCLSHALTHESISYLSKDSISIVVRFLKNLLHHWQEIAPRYDHRFKTVQQIVDGEDLADATIDELYNMSYEITMQDDASSDEEDHAKVNTDNLISPYLALNGNGGALSKGFEKGFSEKKELQQLFDNRLLDLSLQSLSSNIKVGSPTRQKNAPTYQTKNTVEKGTKNTTSIQIQFPPQKYKFEPSSVSSHVTKPKSVEERAAEERVVVVVKKPVIRGRKVGELTRIFEERSQAIKILNTL